MSGRPILIEGEIELLLVPKVALYDRDVPCPPYQDGTVTLTNHRILWKDTVDPKENSISLSLSLIERIESKSGFLTSSPKLFLYLKEKQFQSSLHTSCPIKAESSLSRSSPTHSTASLPITNISTSSAEQQSSISSTWKCLICDESNSNANFKCATCGVRRQQDSDAPINLPVLTTASSCAICTFDNKPGIEKCKMCGSPLIPEPCMVDQKVAPAKVIGHVKLSFRSGNPLSNFIAHLQMAMKKAAWTHAEAIDNRASSSSTSPSLGPLVVGVAGLLRKAKEDAKNTDTTLTQAFTDLDTLFDQAEQMSKLAESISKKLEQKTDTLTDTQNYQFRTLLQDLGLAISGAAVTKEMVGSSYHIELARQLAEFLDRLFVLRQSNIAPLPDIFCLYNRTRGTLLISPHDLVTALKLLPTINAPFCLKSIGTFGLLVVQSTTLSIEGLTKRVSAHLEQHETISTIEFANQENVSITVAAELLSQIELSGLVCRDQTTSITVFYKNLLLQL